MSNSPAAPEFLQDCTTKPHEPHEHEEHVSRDVVAGAPGHAAAWRVARFRAASTTAWARRAMCVVPCTVATTDGAAL